MAVAHLWRLCEPQVSDVLFLMKICIGESKLEFIKTVLGFKNMFVVRGSNTSGGLACFKSDSVTLNLSYFQHHVDFMVGAGITDD